VNRRHTRLSLTLALTLAFVGALPAPAAAAAPSLRSSVIQDGLQYPWDVDFAPGGQMFVTERPGRVRVYRSAGINAGLLATTSISVRAQGEAGLMGIAVDPRFNSNRLVYVCASRTYNGAWLNQLIRYKVRSNWTLAFDRYLIRTGMRASTIHNGCAVEVGPDLKVWVTMGDGSIESLAQNPKRLNGKVLRINRDGSIPSDNPIMPGTSTRTAVYSMGHRNPQGIAFHPGNNRVYIIEHGPNVNDEINWIRPGLNYGWPCVTGNGVPYHDSYSVCGTRTFTSPVWRSGSSTIATSGGTFVAGSAWDSFQNHLFVSQLKQSDVRRFRISKDGLTGSYAATYFNNSWGRLRAANLGSGNRLFVSTSNGSNDKVIRITPVPAG
jgi:glucose/arabinose dehydrogenase